LGKGNFSGTFDFTDSAKHSEDKLSKACKDRYVFYFKIQTTQFNLKLKFSILFQKVKRQ
jgi:hypothetical protein